MTTRKFVIERSVVSGGWTVTVQRPDEVEIVFGGTAQECVEWCLARGMVRLGPRVFEGEGR